MLADEELVKIGEVDGEPAAFMVLLPNINEVVRDLDGRLLPFGDRRRAATRNKARH